MHELTVHTVYNLILPCQGSREGLVKYYDFRDLIIELYQFAKPVIMLGQDYSDLITSLETHSVGRNAPIASRTTLGWVVHGHIPSTMHGKSKHPETYTCELYGLIDA